MVDTIEFTGKLTESFEPTNLEYSIIKNIYYPSIYTLYDNIEKMTKDKKYVFNSENALNFLIKIINEVVDIEEKIIKYEKESNNRFGKIINYLNKIKKRYVNALIISNYPHLLKTTNEQGVHNWALFRLSILGAITYVSTQRKLDPAYNGYQSLLTITQKSNEEIKNELQKQILETVEIFKNKFPHTVNKLKESLESLSSSVTPSSAELPVRPNIDDDDDESDQDDDQSNQDPAVVPTTSSSGGGGRVTIGSTQNLTLETLIQHRRIQSQSRLITRSQSDSSDESAISPPNVTRESSISSDTSSLSQEEENQKFLDEIIKKNQETVNRQEALRRGEGTSQQREELDKRDQATKRYFEEQRKAQTQVPSFLQQAPSQTTVPPQIARPPQAAASSSLTLPTQQEVDRRNREAASMIAAMNQATNVPVLGTSSPSTTSSRTDVLYGPQQSGNVSTQSLSTGTDSGGVSTAVNSPVQLSRNNSLDSFASF